jgi:hypothetical protein
LSVNACLLVALRERRPEKRRYAVGIAALHCCSDERTSFAYSIVGFESVCLIAHSPRPWVAQSLKFCAGRVVAP